MENEKSTEARTPVQVVVNQDLLKKLDTFLENSLKFQAMILTALFGEKTVKQILLGQKKEKEPEPIAPQKICTIEMKCIDPDAPNQPKVEPPNTKQVCIVEVQLSLETIELLQKSYNLFGQAMQSIQKDLKDPHIKS